MKSKGLYDFVHLKTRTDFSIKTGFMSCKEIVKACKKHGMSAVALTDINMFSGMVRFYTACIKEGVRPICGVECNYMDSKKNIHTITLYAMNEEGYTNIRRLISAAYIRAFGKNELTLEEKEQLRIKDPEAYSFLDDERVYLIESDMEQWKEGVACLIDSYYGPIGNYARMGHYQNASPHYEKLISIYGMYCVQGISRCNRPGEKELEPYVLNLANKHKLSLVAVNDVLFERKKDCFNHTLRVCISEKSVFKEFAYDYTMEQYFKSKADMLKTFRDIPQALENAVIFSKLFCFKMKLYHSDLPSFHLDRNHPVQAKLAIEFDKALLEDPTIDQEIWLLKTLANKGLKQRLEHLYPDPEERERMYPKYKERLDYELKVIIDMKFPGYFLIVQEFINWSKENGIPVGPGRGSGAGSLVAYSLRITDLDPLSYSLLFERFLNPMRKSMPDFDVDFCNEGRNDVINHVKDRYGKECVSQIMTFGKMGGKMVVRDVARAMGLDRKKAEDIARNLLDSIEINVAPEDEEPIIKKYKGTLQNNVDLNPPISLLYHSDDHDYKDIIDSAIELEGLTRQVGKHAAGIVISPGDINKYSAVYLSEDGEQCTHFDKGDVEATGLVKFDFLGLKNLTIIKKALNMINPRRRKEGLEDLDVSLLRLNDKATYELLQRGDTLGIFQLESPGITQLVKQSEPSEFEDIVAILALYRPGPLQTGMVDNYINRKKGKEKVYYPDPSLTFDCLKEILDPTYGIIVYQEQVMQIAQVFSGYTLGDADNLRRAMGKKDEAVMIKETDNFVKGAIAKGHNHIEAEQLFNLILKFAGYGFNKSHSAAYAFVTYQTAYLKAHYRAELLAAVLSVAQNEISSLYKTIKDLTHPEWGIDIKLEKPDINTSKHYFYVNDNGKIVYSLAALKGIGEDIVEKMVEEREKNGDFKSIYDFHHRCPWFSDNNLKVMIHSGVFSSFIEANKDKHHSEELYLHLLKEFKKEAKEDNGLIDVFIDDHTSLDRFITPKVLAEVKPLSIAERFELQYKAFSFYFYGHPLEEFAGERKALGSIENLKVLDEKFQNFKAISSKKGNSKGNYQRRNETYIVIASVDYTKVTKNGDRTRVEVEISDESGIKKTLRYNCTERKPDELADLLLTEGFVCCKVTFKTFMNKEKKEEVQYLLAEEVQPLSEAVCKTPGILNVLFDARNKEDIDKIIELYKNVVFEYQVNTYEPHIPEGGPLIDQVLKLSVYTDEGVVYAGENFDMRVTFTPELISAIKNLVGPGNMTFSFNTKRFNRRFHDPNTRQGYSYY